MANILKFPENSGETKRQTVLQDGDDILHFDDQNLANGHTFVMPAEKSHQKLGKIRAKDWSNQELANLFRVQWLLNAAGVQNDIDRGTTDEGDPWFVFCDCSGEVFIHLCRLDDIYVLDSPNISKPLRGQDFNTLIEAFTKRKGSEEANIPDTQRVVRLERHGKVFLHPSTMLAALVWTLFLAAEELVVIMPEKGTETSEFDLSDELASVSRTTDQDTGFDPRQLILQDMDMMQAEVEKSGKFVSQNANDTDAFSEQKLGQNTYAIGLSAVAISLGFMSETEIPDMDVMTLESILAMMAGQDNTGEEGADVLYDLGLTQNGAQEFLAALTQFFDEAARAVKGEKKLAGSGVDEHQDTKLTEQMEKVVDGAEQITVFLNKQGMPQDAQPSVEVHNISADRETVHNPLTAQTTAYAPENDQIAHFLSKVGLVNVSENINMDAHEYTFANGTVVATFNLNAHDLGKATDLITSSLGKQELDQDIIDLTIESSSEEQKQLQIYGEEAFEFITFLMFKETDLEVMKIGDDLVLLDLEVFDIAKEDTFSAFWTTDNGEIISAIGLRSDYESYDVIT